MHRGGATAAVVQCPGPRSVAEVVASPGGKQAVEVLVKDGQPSCVCWCCSFVVGPCQGDGCEVILFGGVDAKAANKSEKMFNAPHARLENRTCGDVASAGISTLQEGTQP